MLNPRPLFRHWLILSVAAMLSACGQPGPLYLPGTTPPFYVPPDTYKSEPDKKAVTEKPVQPETQKEPEQKPVTGQEQLDQPPTPQ